MGGAGTDAAYGVAVSGTGVYAAGEYTGPAAFGPFALNSAGSTDVAVVKLTDAGPSGTGYWARGAVLLRPWP